MLPSKMFFGDLFNDYDKSERNLMKCDISVSDGNYLIEVEMPGTSKEDISMDIDGGYLTIKAESKKEEKEEKEYIRRERCEFTSCSRRFYVGNVNENAISANFKDGILRVVIPKEDEQPTKKSIQID